MNFRLPAELAKYLIESGIPREDWPYTPAKTLRSLPAVPRGWKKEIGNCIIAAFRKQGILIPGTPEHTARENQYKEKLERWKAENADVIAKAEEDYHAARYGRTIYSRGAENFGRKAMDWTGLVGSFVEGGDPYDRKDYRNRNWQ